MFKSLKSMENNKSPGNDGFSKEFYECLKRLNQKAIFSLYSLSISKSGINYFSKSGKKVGKKDKDERFIKNWRPI